MADTEYKPSILIVKPGAVDEISRSALAQAGVIIVETADPHDARIIMPEMVPLSGNDLMYAALSALDDYRRHSSVPAADFVTNMRAAMKKAREAERAKPADIVRGPGGRFMKPAS